METVATNSTGLGLEGEALTIEEVTALEAFAARKSNFADRLRDCFVHRVSGAPIRAAVRREYGEGDVMCTAGEYGSTAFLLIEGSATALVPEQPAATQVRGRTASSLERIARIFRRRGPRVEADAKLDAELVAIGEVSVYATLRNRIVPPPRRLKAGDFFGVDTCINFYPREASVRADAPCVVVEMLRSVLDTVRASGKSGAEVNQAYAAAAIRDALAGHPLFDNLSDREVEQLAAGSELLVPDDLAGGVFYALGDPADSLFVVRAGSVKFSQRGANGELVWAYAGRGTAFGLEGLAPLRSTGRLVLERRGGAAEPAVVLAGTVSVGRRTSATVSLDLKLQGVSRHHCRFESRDDDVIVIDEDSDNGTWLNGERVREAVVSEGDEVSLGGDVTFVIAAERAAATAESALRVATATALDNVEVVRVSVADLRRVAPSDPRMLQVAAVAEQALLSARRKPPHEQGFLHEVTELGLYNSQNALLIDLDRCTRCDECVRACADSHGGTARLTRDGPRFGKFLVTMACRSCSDPKCMIGCPVGSIRRKGSLEIHIEDWCVGCGSCANNCPYGNINMVDLAAPISAPDVDGPIDLTSGRLKATVCDLCSGLDGPSCVYACPHDAAIRVKPAAFLAASDLRR